jgi:hypothetical protein
VDDFTFTLDLSGLGNKLDMGKVRTAAKQGLYLFAEEVMAASKEVCPVDTSALMNSGHVGRHTPPGVTPEFAYDTEEGVAIDLGYGSEAVGYAVYVHENLDPVVAWSKPGSGPKFLENPLKDRQSELPGRILDSIKRVLGVL